MYKEAIRIGTLASAGDGTAEYLKELLPYGFESFSLTYWEETSVDPGILARQVKEALADSDAVISSISVFGNPLATDAMGAKTRNGWKKCIDAAHLFGCDLVTGFAGAVTGRSVPDSMKRYAKVYGPLAKRAADKGVRLAFENCGMDGTWEHTTCNIAMTPAAWDLMFDAIPSDNIGLQWEPCHQMVKLVDPMPQLRKYIAKMFCLHGKDATVYWDVVREHGIAGPHRFAFHRTPGFGDSNWTDIISELRRGGFVGSIDIEGWHDPVYRDELEIMGQVHALNHLKQCRGGTWVPPVNPSAD